MKKTLYFGKKKPSRYQDFVHPTTKTPPGPPQPSSEPSSKQQSQQPSQLAAAGAGAPRPAPRHKFISINLAHLMEDKDTPRSQEPNTDRKINRRSPSGQQSKRCGTCTRSVSSKKRPPGVLSGALSARRKLAPTVWKLSQKTGPPPAEDKISLRQQTVVSPSSISHVTLSQFTNPLQFNEDELRTLEQNEFTLESDPLEDPSPSIFQKKASIASLQGTKIGELKDKLRATEQALAWEMGKGLERRVAELESKLSAKPTAQKGMQTEQEQQPKGSLVWRARLSNTNQQLLELCIQVLNQVASFTVRAQNSLPGGLRAHCTSLREVVADLAPRLTQQITSLRQQVEGDLEMTPSPRPERTPAFLEVEDSIDSPFSRARPRWEMDELISCVTSLSKRLDRLAGDSPLEEAGLERIRREISPLSIQTEQPLELQETPKRAEIIDQFKWTLNAKKQLDSLREQKSDLEEKLEDMIRRWEEQKKEVLRWQQKCISLAKAPAPEPPRPSQLETLLEAPDDQGLANQVRLVLRESLPADDPLSRYVPRHRSTVAELPVGSLAGLQVETQTSKIQPATARFGKGEGGEPSQEDLFEMLVVEAMAVEELLMLSQ